MLVLGCSGEVRAGRGRPRVLGGVRKPLGRVVLGSVIVGSENAILDRVVLVLLLGLLLEFREPGVICALDLWGAEVRGLPAIASDGGG